MSNTTHTRPHSIAPDIVSSKSPLPPIVELRAASKSYPVGGAPFLALAAATIAIPASALVAIVGKSGSGKSTLLNLIAGIDRATSGSVSVAGVRLETLSEGALSRWRGKNVGVVFQFFQLLPTLTVVENVMLPMDFCGALPPVKARERAMELLAQLGIESQAHKLPTTLSGGQQQRAAIARALANDPPLIVADEPTGNLDSHTAGVIVELLRGLARDGKSVLLVTHERDLAASADHVISIVDGRIEQPRSTQEAV
ncbi:MAG: ABC transporter ATP-binding protein [Deltaproteobacteria bacterium]|nr:ABC transporter ATP-binding protein [Deltaproteobacteria bacterium]